MGFGNFEACTQYHTSSSKASPFNPSQVVPLARTVQYIPIHEPFSFRPPQNMTSINPQSNPSYMRQTFRGIPIWLGTVNLGEVESHTYNHPICIWGKERCESDGCRLSAHLAEVPILPLGSFAALGDHCPHCVPTFHSS